MEATSAYYKAMWQTQKLYQCPIHDSMCKYSRVQFCVCMCRCQWISASGSGQFTLSVVRVTRHECIMLFLPENSDPSSVPSKPVNKLLLRQEESL